GAGRARLTSLCHLGHPRSHFFLSLLDLLLLFRCQESEDLGLDLRALKCELAFSRADLDCESADVAVAGDDRIGERLARRSHPVNNRLHVGRVTFADRLHLVTLRVGKIARVDSGHHAHGTARSAAPWSEPAAAHSPHWRRTRILRRADM